MSTRPPFFTSALDFLKHPLLLLMVGSIVGSILIPHISERTSRTKALQDARLRKAVEIIDNNTRTISQLNALRTRLGMFHNDNVRSKPTPAKLKEWQDKLGADMNDRYLEFEKTGWWWYRDLNDEAVILEIVPPTGSDKLRNDVNAYHTNILDTVKALNEMWHPYVDADYDYKDSHMTEVQESVSKEWDKLTNARTEAVNNLVADFTQAR
jgi:hypothetical protein